MRPGEASQRSRLSATSTLLAEVLREHASSSAPLWLSSLLHTTASSPHQTAREFAAAGRKLGGGPVGWSAEHQAALAASAYPGFLPATLGELGRAWILLQFACVAPLSDVSSLLQQLYYKGAAAEQAAVLRGLSLMPVPTEHTLIATDAVRSHVQPVFEALTCSNPYPALYFNDSAFNQMVMKAFFTGVQVNRITDLAQRNNAELRRMALDFCSERTSAGRPLPPDVDQVVSLS